jgi:LCP family protein required for cell wall assembly
MASDSRSGSAGVTPSGSSDGPSDGGASPPAEEYRRWQGPPSDRRRRVPRRRSREKTFLLLVIGTFVVFAGVAIAVATWTTKQLDSSVDRVADVFPVGERPPPAEAGLTMLLVGRDPIPSGAADGLADSIVLVHVTGGRASAQVVYLPVHAQVVPGGPTLDQSFSQDGPTELISDVEALTGVRMDHYAEVDFAGFREVTDAVGGVDVDVPAPYSGDGYDFPAGRQHLDGDEALAYVRHAGRASEASSAERQRAVMNAMFSRITEDGLLTDVGRITSTLNSLAAAVRIDDTLGDTELVQLVWSLRSVARLDFVTAPVADPVVQDGQLVATFDADRAPTLWEYLQDDRLSEHLDEFR